MATTSERLHRGVRAVIGARAEGRGLPCEEALALERTATDALVAIVNKTMADGNIR